MTESIAVRVARLDERSVAIEAKVDANNALAIESNAKLIKSVDAMSEQLKTLNSVVDEWRGVRKALAALGAILVGVGALVGSALTYLSHK